MNLTKAEFINLLTMQNSSAARLGTGSYVDLQGSITKRELKFMWSVAPGHTSPGTVIGSIQSAEDTSGTGLTTVLTFSTSTSAGTAAAEHAVLTAGHRYVRGIYAIQTSKDMSIGFTMIAEARVHP
jgi:hypothetical protein